MTLPGEEAEATSARAGRFADGTAEGLRIRTARGSIVTSVFLVATQTLVIVQGVVIAGLLSTEVYGQWGLMMAALITLTMVGNVGVEDKYIQQDDPDQQRAFEVAFTFQVLVCGALALVVAAGMPIFATIYGRPELIGPGIALAAAVPAVALHTPLWVHYRRMDFARQRTLQMVAPVASLVVTVTLVLVGPDLWGMVIGAVAGFWIAAIVIVHTSPYPLRLRWDPTAFVRYRQFSGPLFVGAFLGAVMIQGPAIVASRFVGVTGAAAIALANSIAVYTTKVDEIVTQSLYPAICAVKDERPLLFESFWKSNRLALLWAAPLGFAAPLFAGDFVHHVLGEKWRYAVPLIGLYGVNAAINQIGFNWSAFFRALGDTRPIAVESVFIVAAVLAIPVPLLAVGGITAFGVGMTAVTLIALGLRFWFLARIFPGLSMLRHTLSGLGPTVPAVVAVLGLRALDPGPRSLARVGIEAALFALVAVAVTLRAERRLLRESVGYLRGVRTAA